MHHNGASLVFLRARVPPLNLSPNPITCCVSIDKPEEKRHAQGGRKNLGLSFRLNPAVVVQIQPFHDFLGSVLV